ncbi:MAG: undecaprenyl-phosphate glucose phosphotransferase [Bdellovibrionales bacterium]|nr:undecaprenyl-phosphate glucose phosphotransferase [Bdellovibrionales bacterium]
MLKRYQNQIGTLLRLSDALTVGATWTLAYWLRFEFQIFEVTKGIPGFGTYATLLPLVVILWGVVFSWMGLYSSNRVLRRTHEFYRTISAHITALTFLLALTYLISDYRYSRATMAIFGFLGAPALALGRLFIRNLVRKIRTNGMGVARTLVVGDGRSAEMIIQRVKKFPELGFQITGQLVADPKTVTEHSRDFPILGSFQDFKSVLEQNHFEEIIFALPRTHGSLLDELLAQVRDETVDIRIVPDLHEYVVLGCLIEDFEGIPVVGVNESPLEGWGAGFKRLTDILLSSFGLLILSPIFALIAIAMRMSSPGPIFYRQERMGMDGRSFQMIKFRSMRVDAEERTGPVWATAEDNRKTPIGTFLRSTSLDELPQLWNVLMGDMSLVGPRPERPFFVNKFRSEIPGYMLRHKVKSGITGWAQVHGWRGDTSLARRIECDLYYIRHWSFWLDIKILCLTVWRGFINRNAY